MIIGIHIHTQLSGKAEILIKILKTHFKEKMDHGGVYKPRGQNFAQFWPPPYVDTFTK